MPLNKIYLDTSIISHLIAPDTPDKEMDTRKLWDYFIDKRYEVFFSNVTLDEIMECSEPKRTKMLDYLAKIKYTKLNENEQTDILVNKYLNYGILTNKSIDDLRHVSLAVIFNCDIIVSWNFKHLVNYKVINKLKEINKILGYNEISILPPTMLIEEEDQIYDPYVDYIHQIRYKHYEETKHMSLQEIIFQSTERAQKVIDEIEKLRNQN